MALTERLAVILDAHAGGLISEFSKAAKAADKVDSSAKGAKKSVDDVGSGADKTGGLIGKLADKAGISSNAMKATLGTVGVAAVGALVAVGVDAVRTYLNLADQVDAFQDVAGGSAQEASQLVNVTKALGIEPEVAAKAFFKLGKDVGSGTSKLADYGIAVAKNKDGTTDLIGTLDNVSTAYRGSSDQATKNAIASAAFGKAAAQLPDLLSLTHAELEALANTGPVFTQQQIDDAKKLDIALRQVGLAKEKALSGVGGFLAKGLVDNLGYVKTLTGGFVDLSFAEEAEREVNAKSAEAKIAASKEAAEAAEQEKKDQDALRDSLLGVANAGVAYSRSQQAVGDAERNAAQKRKDLNDLLKKGAVDAKAVESATRSLETANRGLATAQERAADARKALDDALAGPSADDLEGSALDLKDANLGLKDAQDEVADAQKAVVDAQKAGDPDALADANRRLEHANLNLEHSTRNQAAAQKALNDLNPASEAGGKRVADAYLGVRDANQQVDDSTRNVKDATDALNKARAGDPEFSEKVATAYLGVRDANNQLADAKRNELGALIDLNDARYKEAALLGAAGDNAARLKDQLNNLAVQDAAIAPLVAALFGQSGISSGTVSTFLPNGTPLNTPGRRATGGPVSAGSTYMVGERGPELVTFGSNGYVTPNGGWGGGGTTNIYLQTLDPAGAGKAVVAALREYNRNSGPVPVTVRG